MKVKFVVTANIIQKMEKLNNQIYRYAALLGIEMKANIVQNHWEIISFNSYQYFTTNHNLWHIINVKYILGIISLLMGNRMQNSH